MFGWLIWCVDDLGVFVMLFVVMLLWLFMVFLLGVLVVWVMFDEVVV